MLFKWALAAVVGAVVGANGAAIDSTGLTTTAPTTASIEARQLNDLPYGVGVGSEGFATLVSNNNKRMDRARQLQGDIDHIYNNLVAQEHAFNTSSIYYRDVYLRFAQQLGYATLEELVAEIQDIIENANLPGKEIFQEMNERSENLETAMMSGFAVALGGGAGHFITAYRGRIARFAVVDVPRFFSYQTFKAITNFHNWINAPRAVAVGIHHGWVDAKFAAQVWRGKAYRIGRPVLISHTAYTFESAGVTNAADFAAKMKAGTANGVVTEYPQATKAVRAGRMANFVKYSFAAAEVAGTLVGIVALIMEVDHAHDVRRDLWRSIKDLDAVRFSVKRLEMQGEAWNTFQGQVAGAAEAWLALQAGADQGTECYVNADEALESSFAHAFNTTIEAMAAVDDVAVWNALHEMDRTAQNFNSWVYDDYNFAELVARAEADMAADAEDDARDLTPEELAKEIDDTVAFEYGAPTVAPAPANASTLRYLELASNKGAVWKLAGPFWTFQRGPGAAGTEDSTVRHRFEETGRSATTISLKLVHTNKPANQPALGAAATIDTAANTFAFASSAYPVDPLFSDVLVPVTGWTTMLVRANTTENPIFTDAYECNTVVGWAMRQQNGDLTSGLKEVSRNKSGVSLSSFSPFAAGVQIDPRANINLTQNTFTYSWASLGVPHSTFELQKEQSLARVTIG